MNKITKHFSNKDTGISSVTISNKFGNFTGYSYCHPDDMENFSAFVGERYAENRAAEKYARARLKQEKIKLKTIQNLLIDITNNNLDTEENKEIIKRIKFKLRDYAQSVEDWENLYLFLKRSIPRQEEDREKVLSRAKKNN